VTSRQSGLGEIDAHATARTGDKPDVPHDHVLLFNRRIQPGIALGAWINESITQLWLGENYGVR
jgi:hypothetical protein